MFLGEFFRSAFFLFCADRRAEIKKINPEFTVGDIAKCLGKQWSETTPEIKTKYEENGKIEKEKYLKVLD